MSDQEVNAVEISLEKYFDALLKGTERQLLTQIASLKEHTDIKFGAIKEATDKALKSNDDRLDSMNEFRGSLKDLAGTLATKDSLEEVKKRINSLENSRAELIGKNSFASVMSIISAIIAVLAIYLTYVK